jgi:hypothetical protein
MPLIYEINMIKFYIYSMDHNPPHVHVKFKGAELICELNNLTITHSKGFKNKEEKLIIGFIKLKKSLFLEAWSEYNEK